MGSDSAAPAPLLDFKSAFTDLENKNDMSFLHDSLDLSSDDLHRALTAPTTEQSKTNSSHQQQQQQQQQSTAHHNNSQQRSHQLHSMDYVSIESSQSHSSFDVNLDAFDILSDFPELSQYESGQPGHHSTHNPALINNSHPGPMLSQAATNSNSHIGATIKTRTLEYRENLVTITDYSPGWSYTDTPDRAGCYTCRKREAPDSGHSNHRGGHSHGVPAKMSHGHAHAQHGHYGHYYGWSGGHHAHPAHHPVNGTVNKG